jgi:hypothetical protein
MRRSIAIVLGLALVSILTIGVALSNYASKRFAPLAVALLRSVSGLDINFRDIRFRVGIHPAIQIYDGELISHNHRLVSFKRLTVYSRYRSLLRNRGLPLSAIVIEAPSLNLPPGFAAAESTTSSNSAAVQSPSAPASLSFSSPNELATPNVTASESASSSPDARQPALAQREPYATRILNFEAQTSKELAQALKTLGNLTLELDIEEAAIIAADGRRMVEKLTLRTYRQSPTSDSWHVGFNLLLTAGFASGAQISGDGTLSSSEDTNHAWLESTVNFSRDALTQVTFNSTTVQAYPRGGLTIVIGNDGRAVGTISLTLGQAIIASPVLKQPTAPTDYVFNSSIAFTGDSLRVNQASLTKGSDLLLAGESALTELATSAPRLALKLREFKLKLTEAKLWLAQLKGLPPKIEELCRYLRSGRLTLEQAELNTKISDEGRFRRDELLKNVRLAAYLDQVGVSLPPALNLPALSDLQAHVVLEKSRLSISHIQARAGGSTLTAGSITVDRISSSSQARFTAHFDASLALDELYASAITLRGNSFNIVRRYLRKIDGIALVDSNAQGSLGPASKFTLDSYTVRIRPKQVLLVTTAPPQSLKLIGGETFIVPGLLTVSSLHFVDGQSSASFDGSAKLDGRDIRLRRLMVNLHQVEIRNWLPLAVKPKDAIARARVDGQLSVLGTPKVDPDFSVHGQLSASPAVIKLGILRSPIVSQSVLINLRGRSAEMAVNNAEFEGEKANLEAKVPDITRSVVQLGITVANLDLHALKFIHFPGEPKPKPKHLSPDTRIFGHVNIGRAQANRLTFTGITLDFDRRGNNWTVSNIDATAYGGHAHLDLKGRSEDDIVSGTTQLSGVDVGWLLTVLQPTTSPVLSGRLNAQASFRADTEDFKQTLDGKGAFRVGNGTAYKLKLLARVLSLMSVSGLLRGRLPDPFVEGIPFHVLQANLTSKNGVLHTEDFLLDGPVLRMSAIGDVDIVNNQLDLTVGVMPFNMLDSILSLLPLVGNDLAGREGLFSIYVTATGPVGDPYVRPAPITSVTKILKKILNLPGKVIYPEPRPKSLEN